MHDAVIFDVDRKLVAVRGVRADGRGWHRAVADRPPVSAVVAALVEAHVVGLAVMVMTSRERDSAVPGAIAGSPSAEGHVPSPTKSWFDRTSFLTRRG
jgi:hypothetical protein